MNAFCSYTRCVLGLLLACFLFCRPVGAQSDGESATADGNAVTASDTRLGQDWVRLLRNDDDELIALQTAIIRYVPRNQNGTVTENGVSVDLVGAIHVGDRAYYRELNRRFEQYDALLYELVAPDGTVVPLGRGTSNAHPVGALQNSMKRMLELEHQLEQIDYTRANFFHADMSPDEFADSMKIRDEGFMQMYFRLLGQSIGRQSKLAAKGEASDLQMLAALFTADRARQLKSALAKQLAEMETLFLDLGGVKGSTLISERNKVALEVLREKIAAGKRRLGIFYGVGHLSDMDQRLREDFDMEPVSITWLTAWDLSK